MNAASSMTLPVAIPGNEYVIYFGEHNLAETIRRYQKQIGFKRAVVVTCETVFRLHENTVSAAFNGCEYDVINLPDGEKTKNLQTVEYVLNRFFAFGLLRTEPVFAVGGGVIGDLAGFCAALYLRGVPFFQIPTTLLAMVDSSIGGKTGINHPTSKNAIGSFYQPKAVTIDIAFLRTLGQREVNSGFAEIIKHGLIRSPELFEWFEQNSRNAADHFFDQALEILFRSCQIKGAVVEQDEKESDLRMILNFGHTFGHVIETITNYSTYLHGEAVFAGMAFAAEFSATQNCLPKATAARIQNVLSEFAPQITLPFMSKAQIVESLIRDKKNRASGISFILLEDIGSPVIRSICADEIADQLTVFLTSDTTKICRMNPQE